LEEAVVSLGSPELYPTKFVPSLNKLGFVYKQAVGTPYWCEEGTAAYEASVQAAFVNGTVPENPCFRGWEDQQPLRIVPYEFLVVSEITQENPTDIGASSPPLCSQNGPAVVVQVTLHYYVLSEGPKKRDPPRYFYSANYSMEVTERLTNPLAPPTGLMQCDFSKWRFSNDAAPASLMLPFAAESRTVYVCTLRNDWFKATSLALPIASLAYTWLVGVGFVLVIPAVRRAFAAQRTGGLGNGGGSVKGTDAV
jgi:hypothetical protein